MFKFSIAWHPQRPQWLLGTGSPGRPPRLAHSSWALTWLSAIQFIYISCFEPPYSNPGLGSRFPFPFTRKVFTLWFCHSLFFPAFRFKLYWFLSVLFPTTWNRTRPRVLMQNQHTMELISARKILLEDVPVVEFMCLVFTRMPGELPWTTQVFVVVFVWRILSANNLRCVLILFPTSYA